MDRLIINGGVSLKGEIRINPQDVSLVRHRPAIEPDRALATHIVPRAPLCCAELCSEGKPS